jgi:sortase B
MGKDAMFGDIGRFADKNYFEAHGYGSIYYGGQHRGIEFFAFLSADAYDDSVYRANIVGSEAREVYLNKLLDMAKYTRNIPVTPEDKIVLLSTCSIDSTNGRDILVGKITDELYDDAFKAIKTNDTPKTDGQASLQMRIIIGAWIVIIAALGIILIIKRRTKRI